jgi:hypothetical protein
MDGEDLKSMAPEYYWQCQGLMMITDLPRWYFVSYDPRFLAEKLRMHIVIIHRDNDDIDKLRIRLEMAIEAKRMAIRRIVGDG